MDITFLLIHFFSFIFQLFLSKRGIRLPRPLVRGRRASPDASYNRQHSRTGKETDCSQLYIRFLISGLVRLLLSLCCKRKKRLYKGF